MLPRLNPAEHTWARCPSCGARQHRPIWPEPEPQPVEISLYCDNPRCPVSTFTAEET